ncbi:hypothetical protein [Botryobacter ruber]|uniref:hypothetical protein n=1 Tax=Botryobacter ruber TaxID=2171629 RepID=UPI000E0A974B|nr:hypothetical protein [Botryobacter ruber]
MKNINKLKEIIVAACMVCLVSFTNSVFAQEATPPETEQQQPLAAFTDAELQQFIDANGRLMVVQEESEKLMLSILVEEKLDINKFNELAVAYQNHKFDEADATPEEKAAFNKIAQRLMELQPVVQKGVQEAIEKDGMSLDKYEKIMIAYQESPVIQARIRSMIAVADE